MMRKKSQLKSEQKNAIQVPSDMENFKEETYCKRKASCPLILMDHVEGKF